MNSFIEQILKDVDIGVEQRLAGPSPNDFNSNGGEFEVPFNIFS
jgi:hypothetical protein